MATGDIVLFDEFAETGHKGMDLSADVIKLAIIDDTVTPSNTDTTPMWVVGSGVDYDGNEVSTAGGYTANGETLTYAGVTRWNQSGGTCTFDADNVALVQNLAGFTDAYWGILYNDTSTNKDAIGYVEMGGPVSEAAGPITFAWNASGLLQVAVP